MKQLRRFAVGALAVLAVVLLVRTGANGWRELRRSDIDVRIGWLGAAVLFAGLAMTWIAWCWHAVMCALTISLGRTSTIAAYFVGEIGKYVPGGIWPVVGRGEVARREIERNRVTSAGPVDRSPVVGRSAIYRSVILSLAYLFLGGLTLGAVAVLVGWSEVSHGWWLVGLVILPVGFVAITPQGTRVLHRIGSGLLRPLGLSLPEIEMPKASISAQMFVRYVPAWCAIAAATWCAAQALRFSIGVAALCAATCLAWVGGFLFLPAPGGLGAREAVFALVLSNTLRPGQAALLAIVSRLAFVLVDALGAAWGVVHLRRIPRN